jgi:hypothetical protein
LDVDRRSGAYQPPLIRTGSAGRFVADPDKRGSGTALGKVGNLPHDPIRQEAGIPRETRREAQKPYLDRRGSEGSADTRYRRTGIVNDGASFERIMMAPHRIRLEDIFFDMYGDIHRAARRRTGAPHIADDIVHDVYVKCRKFTGDFATREEGRAYLLQIAANLSIDHVRIERRRAEILNGCCQSNANCSPHDAVRSLSVIA